MATLTSPSQSSVQSNYGTLTKLVHCFYLLLQWKFCYYSYYNVTSLIFLSLGIDALLVPGVMSFLQLKKLPEILKQMQSIHLRR